MGRFTHCYVSKKHPIYIQHEPKILEIAQFKNWLRGTHWPVILLFLLNPWLHIPIRCYIWNRDCDSAYTAILLFLFESLWADSPLPDLVSEWKTEAFSVAVSCAVEKSISFSRFTCVHTHAHAHTCVSVHICIHTWEHTCLGVSTHVCIYVGTHTHAHTCVL